MDAEHRHELQENALANWLADLIDKVQPQLPVIALGAGAALVGWFGWSSWSDSSDAVEESAWQSYSIAVNSGVPNLPVLKQVAEDHTGTTVVPWADITWADGRLMMASQALLRDRAQASPALDEAEAKYQALVASGSTPVRVRDRAHFGLARVAELRGDVEAAIAAYEQVGGAFEPIAENRVEELADERVKADVEWLASADAAPAAPFNPSATAAPDATPDPIALPSDIAAPEDTFSDLLKSIEGAAEEAEAATEETGEASADEAAGEAAGEAGPTTEASVAEEPMAEEPAAEEPVVDETAAEESAPEETAAEPESGSDAPNSSASEEAVEEAAEEAAATEATE